MNISLHTACLILGCVTLTLQACSTRSDAPADTPYELSEDYLNSVVRYTVQQGDRLSDIALEFTGDAQQWKDIAEYNGVDNPRSLRAGAILEIPGTLIPGYGSSTARRQQIAQAADSNGRAIAAVSPESQNTQATRSPTGTLAVQRSGDVGSEPIAEVVVSPVRSNREFELTPLDESSLSGLSEASMTGPVPQIKVIGTYYPKGIYEQPATYSKLLMRVAPGTLFELDREVNDWFKVVTDAGVGYIRAVDGQVVNSGR